MPYDGWDGRGPAGAAGVDEWLSDGSLVRRLRDGSDAAAHRLYERYAGRLRAFVRARAPADLYRRVDADDIVQSVFRRFFTAARAGSYDVPAGDDLWDLLLAITLNRVRSEMQFQRAAKRDVRRTADGGAAEAGLERAAQPGCPEEALFVLIIDETLDSLPEGYRPVVELRMEGHEVAEIARQVGRSKRTVERILQEVRRELSESLCGGC